MLPENPIAALSLAPHAPIEFRRRAPRLDAEAVAQRLAQAGLTVGAEVICGGQPGVIVGYNVGPLSRLFCGDGPLLIRTAGGLARCAAANVTLV